MNTSSLQDSGTMYKTVSPLSELNDITTSQKSLLAKITQNAPSFGHLVTVLPHGKLVVLRYLQNSTCDSVLKNYRS